MIRRSFVSGLLRTAAWITAFAVISVLPLSVQAAEAPSMFGPDVRLDGVWVTDGGKAPNLTSQITFGVKTADGGLLMEKEGKVAFRYGIGELGSEKHREVNTFAEVIDGGFMWTQQVGPTNAEIVCMYQADNSLRCDRNIVVGGTPFHNVIEYRLPETANTQSSNPA